MINSFIDILTSQKFINTRRTICCTLNRTFKPIKLQPQLQVTADKKRKTY
jgi:hypothetical protein